MRLMYFKHCHKLVSICFMVSTYSTSPIMLSVRAESVIRQRHSGRISWDNSDGECCGHTDYSKVKYSCMANEVDMALMLLMQFHLFQLSMV